MTTINQLTIALWLSLLPPALSLAQETNRPAAIRYPAAPFTADWIGHPTASLTEYGVFHLRKRVRLATKPATFIVHLSGDQRYRLWVNATPVCSGPARGDLRNWHYETIDLAPYLRAGDNVLAVQVWNMGPRKPPAQVSYQTGFILQGNSPTESVVNTDTTWRISCNEGYFANPYPFERLNNGYIIGDCDSVDVARYPHGWQTVAYNDQPWLRPKPESRATLFNEPRRLTPRTIPLLEERSDSVGRIVRQTGLRPAETRPAALTIPAHSHVVLLFDQTNLTTAYPELVFSGGKNSRVRLTYAEALLDSNHRKGNRNELSGKTMVGYSDVFLPDGGAQRLFRPLWFRTFRYVQAEIDTGAEPLRLERFTAVFTAYPFAEKASFSSNDPTLAAIWKTGWRTARLCAQETYMDCPYYEQLQYVGDTRIQALISLYVSGDDRLMRQAIEQFYQSRIPDGLTKDAYPAGYSKIIPPFSLFWVSMLHDFYRYRDDKPFIAKYLLAVQEVLAWFDKRVDTKGMLGPLPYWNYVDATFPMGVPGSDPVGHSAILSLHYAYTLEQAAQLFAGFGDPGVALRYREQALRIKKSVYARCYDPKRRLLADTPDKTQFSQHANIWAVLTDCVPPPQQAALLERTLTDATLTQTTLYYGFYLTQALREAGLGHRYVGRLSAWQQMLAQGLTTFPEANQADTRSDCHAWSASPCYDFLATICGIESAEPGFKSVRISPNLGPLQSVTGRMPHPNGLISVTLKKTGSGGLAAEVILPPGLRGQFMFRGKQIRLRAGGQQIRF